MTDFMFEFSILLTFLNCFTILVVILETCHLCSFAKLQCDVFLLIDSRRAGDYAYYKSVANSTEVVSKGRIASMDPSTDPSKSWS